MIAAKTITQADAAAKPQRDPHPEELALTILWSAREPERIGESCVLSAQHPLWILGRAPFHEEARPGEPVLFGPQRPAPLRDESRCANGQEALKGELISRRQLRIEVRRDFLRIENIGRCQMLHHGSQVGLVELHEGDTLHLQNQLLLLCTRRPCELPPLAHLKDSWRIPFGEEDQHGIVGESPAVWKLRDRIASLANAREITIPSSSAGKEDIPLLVRHLLKKLAREGDPDAPRFLENGQPRIRPCFVEELVHHHYQTQMSELAFLLGKAMADSPQDCLTYRMNPPEMVHAWPSLGLAQEVRD